MWLLRGAAKSIRNHNPLVFNGGLSSHPSRILRSNNNFARADYKICQHTTVGGYAISKIFLYESTWSSNFLLGGWSICSLADEKVNNENEGVLASEDIVESILEDDSTDDDNNIKLSESYPLVKVLMAAPHNNSLNDVLEKWIEDGNKLDRGEVSVAMISLQKHRRYGKALQFMEWLEAAKLLNFVEHDYATQLDLVAKVHGLQCAETFINKIPESLRNEIIYRTFLANCVSALNVKKAEEVFCTIRDIGLPITIFSCDQLLLLYSKVDKRKVPTVLEMMKIKSIKPSIFTYRILIDLKGRSNDIIGMEQIIEEMKSEKMGDDLIIRTMVVKFYIHRGHNEKAEAILKEIEGENIKDNRDACKDLLCLYADLKKVDDVERIWNVCEGNPRFRECLSAIEAFGKVGNVEKAEEIFEEILKSSKKISFKCYNALLRVYAYHKRLFECEDLVNRMKQSGIKCHHSTFDILVKFYIEVGELEKAEYLIMREDEYKNIGHLQRCRLYLLREYSKRGDIANAEKLFNKMKQSRFRYKMTLYQFLLKTYLNARSPVYGFRERMRADNIFPNRQLSKQLAALDALLKTDNKEVEELDSDSSLICSKRHDSTHS